MKKYLMKIIRHEDDINFQIDDDGDGFFNGSSHSPYIIVDLNILIKMHFAMSVAPKYLWSYS